VREKEERRMVWIFYPLLTVPFSYPFPPVFVSCFLLLFVDTNYFSIHYHTRTQPFPTLFPFRLFFFFPLIRFLGSYYHSLITHFFPYLFLSSFFLFSLLFPFSHIYSQNTYNSSIQPFILDPADGQGPVGILVAFCSIFFACT